ncbi:LLM class flavin-dependent oxidoreductase [Pseudorhodoferax sp.]|uniref:LLM class flavin-dependent oxidoreductase n=1 Tax=Pseudorhodoferax sp. TaxID=1993553 RepID=UPI002DD69A75|nr:LLM class flavin-dependent oxidoreductase [Pseudorhodoferax sp.]
MTQPLREIRINAFAMMSPVHHSPGLWRHPQDQSLRYTDLDYWVNLARTLERGLVDALFIADGIGGNETHGGSPAAAFRHGAQVPKLDPLLTVSAMAHATRHLGFGITSNANHEPPFVFARRMSTLDHLTKGRIGWNIVTGHSHSGARALGLPKVTEHDKRYDIADEYLDVVYQLWEGSWDDRAVRRDQATGEFADPAHIRAVHHHGEHFKVDGIHLAEPSPQRTPLLFQAGSSRRGRAFAGRHAECIYISGPSQQVLAPTVAATRAEAVRAGRRADDLQFFAMATIITGRTDEEAQEKLRDYQRYASSEAAIVVFSGWTGIDFSKYDPDEPIRHIETDEGVLSALENFTISDPNRVWTVREMALHNSIGGRGPVFVGSPQHVVDQMVAWQEATDIDGFNLSYAITPGAYEDFADFIVPELQRRGRYKTAYREGTLREKLGTAGGARLPERHPAARFRAPGTSAG